MGSGTHIEMSFENEKSLTEKIANTIKIEIKILGINFKPAKPGTHWKFWAKGPDKNLRCVG